MAFGIFIHRADSIYDDNPAERYQFPQQYLGRASACVGDWIIYYEPRKGPLARGYFAVAKVEQIIPDPTAANMHLALIAAGTYLDFAQPVAFSGSNGPVESGLLNEEGRISCRAQSAVRPLSVEDFNRIVTLGLNDRAVPLARDVEPNAGLDEERLPYQEGQPRDRVAYISSRIVRDRVFRQVVLRAYDARCAVTGLKLINGGGRAEVAAAHVRPVEKDGPDIVNNGIALSGTIHWMFDRGLIGLGDDLEIPLSRQLNYPDSVRAMLNKTGRALPTRLSIERPHPTYLRWHREHCFKY